MKSTTSILSLYGIKARKIVPLQGGLINKTWRVETSKGKYILQWVNPIFSHKIMEDLEMVISHLKKNGFTTVDFLKTKNNKLYIPDTEGFWRMCAYIPGSMHLSPKSPKLAEEAGRIIGEFHKNLSILKLNFRSHRPLHRESQKIYKKFLSLSKKYPKIFTLQFKSEISPLSDMQKLFLPKSLPKRITHGDPKIANIIFDKKNNAVALIDLDDCGNKHSTLVDVGDALRSLCKNNDYSFSVAKYKQFLRGYFRGSQGMLTKREIRLIPQSLKLITLELACRFAIDIAEDYYFGWDEEKHSSRKEHNKLRVSQLIKYYQDICAHEKEIMKFLP